MPNDSGFLGLGKAARFVRSAFSRVVKATTALPQLIRTVREKVGIVTPAEIRQIQREAIEAGQRPTISSQLEPDDLIPYSMMQERGDLIMTKNAQYRLRLTVIDPESGQLEFVYRSIASDQHFTEEGVTSLARELFTSGGSGYDYQFESIDLEDVWIQPGAKLVW